LSSDGTTCNQLLASYRHSVNHFKKALRRGARAVGDDCRLTGKQAEHLAKQCREANDAFVEHWRQGHGNLEAKAASSANLLQVSNMHYGFIVSPKSVG
jgi:hypothetical protein